MLKKWLKTFTQKHSKWSIALILIGTFIWSITVVKSGIVYSYGMGFWGPNGHDAIWHIALIESLSRGSFDIPVFAGEALKNYHIGYDLLVAIVHKLTNIPVVTLYFQVLAPLIALFIGFLSYKFVYIWRGSKREAFWATFFVYFGTGWGWLITLIRDGSIGGESLFWSQQSISTLINPPYALSILLMLAGLNLLVSGIRSKSRTKLVFVVVLFGILIQIKVYAGLLILGGLLLAGLWQIVRDRETLLFKIFIPTLILSIVLFFPVNTNSVSIIEIKPFWFLESMMGANDRLAWHKFAEAMLS